MAPDEDLSDSGSVKSEKNSAKSKLPCTGCKRGCATECALCPKCIGLFHLSCLGRHAAGCKGRVMEMVNPLVHLTEIEHLKILLKRTEEKCDVLEENNNLLREEVYRLKSRLTSNAGLPAISTAGEPAIAPVGSAAAGSQLQSDPNVPKNAQRRGWEKPNLTLGVNKPLISVNRGVSQKDVQPNKLATEVNDGQETANAKNKQPLEEQTIRAVNGKQEFKVVQPRQAKRRPLRKRDVAICTGNTEIGLGVEPRKAWFFLGRFSKEIKDDEVKSHVESLIGENIKFALERLETKSIIAASFKVGVPFDSKEKILNPNNWPAGVEVGRYHFRRAPKQEQMR